MKYTVKNLLKWGSACCILLSASVLAEIQVNTQSLNLIFNQWGDLIHTEACFPDCTGDNAKKQVLSSKKGMLVFNHAALSQPQLTRDSHDTHTILTFSGATDDIIRRWEIPNQGWSLSVTSNGLDQAVLMSGKPFRPPQTSGFGYLLEQTRYLIFDGSDIETLGLDATEELQRDSSDWFGFRNRFWAVMARPNSKLPIQFDGGESVEDAKVTIQLNTSELQSLNLYLGPVAPAPLHQAAAELEGLMYSGLWFWLRWICQGFYILLGYIVVLVPNWGVSIMLLSLLVTLVMWPLSNYAERLQTRVHEIDSRLAARLAAIKKNYKGATQSEKIIALYKEEGVHPLYSLKSLMGIVFIIPVFIGVFNMLSENIHLLKEPFLWVVDLSLPDAFAQLPFKLPFFGEYINLLPFIMTGFSFVASKLHVTVDMDPILQRKQTRNLFIMSFSFLALFYTFPAGMVLYWATTNLFSIIKTLLARYRQKSNVVLKQ